MSALALVAVLAVLVQVDRPKVTTTVDRDRITVGDEIVFSVTAVSRAAVPMQVAVAPPSGFEIIARTERTEVSYDGGPSRTTTLEMRLRALRPGKWRLGPVEARQGKDTVTADAITVDVIDAPNAATTLLNPRVRQLLERAPPPRAAGGVGLSVTLSADTARVGEQIDVVTAAWFPRDLRLQLRRSPVLLPPVLAGVWSYAQPAPPGIATSRKVGDSTYDLFVAHQVVFPLVPGVVTVPAAELHYSVPVALQFFSQEERYSVQSRPDTLMALPLPDLHRPSDFTGAVGRGLRVERTIDPASPRVGEAVIVDISVAGEGNLALWPAPELRWPQSVRAYSDRVDERITTADGRLGGTKTFRYLVVPQTAGTVTLPELRYPYFDTGVGDYAVAGTAAARLAVAASGEAVSARALPPDLLDPSGTPVALAAARAMWPWGWVPVALLPPLVVLIARRPRRKPKPAPRRPDSLAAAEARLEAALRAVVPDPAHREGPHLVQSLRGAGVEPAVAQRMAAVRQRLFALRYGPDGGKMDAKLLAEVEEVVHRLDVAGRATLVRVSVVAVALLACSLLPLRAQAPTSERLYETGALRAAADGFAQRAARLPDDPANWYDLGAARYRLGEDGRAAAAWLRAARLAPRSPTVQRALRLTPAPDDLSQRRRWVPSVTAAELALAAALCWIVGWTLLPIRRRAGRIVLAVAVVAGLLGGALQLWLAQPLALALGTSPVRLSPHGRGEPVAAAESGAAVRIVERRGDWLLVEGPNGRRGWLPRNAVAMVTD